MTALDASPHRRRWNTSAASNTAGQAKCREHLSHVRVPVTTGRMSPLAPSTSCEPMTRRLAGPTSRAQAVDGWLPGGDG